MADGKVVIDSILKDNGVKKGITEIKKRLSEMEGSFKDVAASADNIDMGNAETDVARVKRVVESLENQLAETAVAAKVTEESLDDIGDGVARGVGEAKRELAGLNVSLLTTSALAAALSLSPSLIPVLAAATAGVMGLASAWVAAGAGVAAYGAVAVTALKPVFKAVGEIAKAEEELANAKTYEEKQAAMEKLAKATEGLSEKQKEAVKSVIEFKKYWKDFTKDMTEPVLDTFILSIGSFEKILTALKPMFKDVVWSVNELFKSFDQSLEAPDVKAFFEWLNGYAGPSLQELGETIGWFFRGFMNLMVAFAPLSIDMSQGLLNMAKGFSEWAASLKDSAGFQAFIDYTLTNGPIFLGFLGNLMEILAGVAIALAPLGAAALAVLEDFTALFTGLLEGSGIEPFIADLEASVPRFLYTASQMILQFLQGFVNALPMLLQMGVNIVVSLIQGIIGMIPQLIPIVSQILVTFVNAFAQYLPMLLQTGMDLLETIISGIISLLPSLAFTAINLVTTLVTNIANKLPQMIDMGTKLLLKLIDGIVKILPNLIKTAGDLIIKIVDTVIKNLPKIIDSGTKVLNALINGIDKVLPTLISTAIKLIDKIMATLIANLPKIIDSGIKLLNALIKGILQILPQLISTALKLIVTIVNALIGALPQIISSGIKLLGALIKGIVGAIPELLSMIKNDVIGGILKALKNVDLWDIGKNIIKGLVNGLKSVKIPTPHFSLKGKMDLNPAGGMSVPSVSVKWYKKGGLFAANSPQLVGMGDATVQEAALPLKPSVLKHIGREILDSVSGYKMNTGDGGSKQPAWITLILGGNEYDVFVDDITETQERKKLRKKRR